MRLGIFAKTFAGSDPMTVLTAARDAGYASVQYNMACSGLPSLPERVDATVISSIVEAREKTSVDICALSATYNMAHPDAAVRGAGLRRLEVLAEAAAALNIGLLTLCSGTRDPDDQWRRHRNNETPEAWTDMLDSMEQAVHIADRFDLYLGVEPELANIVNSAEKAARLIRDMATPRIKVVFDPANLFETTSRSEQRRIVSAAVDLLGEHVAIGHAKDRTADGAFIAAGQGVLDYDHYLGCLFEAGFDGVVVTHGLDSDEAPAVSAFLSEALWRQDLGRRP